MSWETHERKEPCPCGKSTITTRWKDDDWNRSEHISTVMDCPDCAVRYEYKCVSIRSDDHSERMAWVEKKKSN